MSTSISESTGTRFAAQPPLRLEMQGINKSFAGVSVLRDVNVQLGAGEVLALLGQNGAGKSTLIKILGGDYPRDSGTILLDGQPVNFGTPQDAIAAGVRILPQELSVIPEMTVAENVMIGSLPASVHFGISRLDRAQMRTRTEELLREIGLNVSPDARLASLGAAEQRIVEITRAISTQARVLVMDEPTAALTDTEARRLFEIMARLRGRGVSIIYISHRMDEVFEVSDKVVALRDGQVTGEFVTAQATRDEVFASMLGDAVRDLYPAAHGQIGEKLLEVGNLRLGRELSGVSLDVRQGEIVGVFGLIGSGIEVLGKALFGVTDSQPSGEVRLSGQPFKPRDPVQAIAQGVGFIAAERKREGILADLSVRENMTLPFLKRFERGGRVSVAAEEQFAQHWIKNLSIRTQGSRQKIRSLSGGNQQKVMLARWLAEGVKLLVMEEPTRGVDVGARKEIYAELSALSRQGLGILMISSDVDEVAHLSDRAVVLDRGRVAREFERGVSAKELMNAASEAVLSH